METNSLKEGPEFNLSANLVGRTLGFVVGVDSASIAVANEREGGDEVRKTLKGEIQGWP